MHIFTLYKQILSYPSGLKRSVFWHFLEWAASPTPQDGQDGDAVQLFERCLSSAQLSKDAALEGSACHKPPGGGEKNTVEKRGTKRCNSNLTRKISVFFFDLSTGSWRGDSFFCFVMFFCKTPENLSKDWQGKGWKEVFPFKSSNFVDACYPLDDGQFQKWHTCLWKVRHGSGVFFRNLRPTCPDRLRNSGSPKQFTPRGVGWDLVSNSRGSGCQSTRPETMSHLAFV